MPLCSGAWWGGDGGAQCMGPCASHPREVPPVVLVHHSRVSISKGKSCKPHTDRCQELLVTRSFNLSLISKAVTAAATSRGHIAGSCTPAAICPPAPWLAGCSVAVSFPSNNSEPGGPGKKQGGLLAPPPRAQRPQPWRTMMAAAEGSQSNGTKGQWGCRQSCCQNTTRAAPPGLQQLSAGASGR